jgi:hypothetical protein
VNHHNRYLRSGMRLQRRESDRAEAATEAARAAAQEPVTQRSEPGSGSA